MSDSYTRTVRDASTYVKRQFGDESDVQITDEDIIRWINISQMELAHDNEFSKKIAVRNVEKGVLEYTFPGLEILYTQTIYVGAKALKFLGFQEYQEYIQKQDGYEKRTGTPEVWTEWGGVFTLWPTPSETIEDGMKVYFITKPADVTDPSSILNIPDRLYTVLLKMLMSHAYQLDENFDAANLQDQRVSNELGKMAYMPEKTSINEYASMTILEPDEYGW